MHRTSNESTMDQLSPRPAGQPLGCGICRQRSSLMGCILK
jgi:hypothetical protein